MNEYSASTGTAYCGHCGQMFHYLITNAESKNEIRCTCCGQVVCKDGVWANDLFRRTIVPPSNIRTVVWHSFPAEEPEDSGEFLVTVMYGRKVDVRTTSAHWTGSAWSVSGVISWAEMPTPFN